MRKTIIFLMVFLLSLSMVSAAELVGTFDSFIVDTDFSDSTYVAQSGPRNVYLHTYPVNTNREWYHLYVTASDPVSQTCDVDLVLQGDVSLGTTTISQNEVYMFVENDPVQFQYIGISGFTGGGTCRVAYGFENTNFDPIPDSSEPEDEAEETTDSSETEDETEESLPDESTSEDESNETEDTEESEGPDSEDETSSDSDTDLPDTSGLMDIIECLDYDGGIDPHTARKVRTNYSGGGYAFHYDTCLSNTTVREYYCTGARAINDTTFVYDNYSYVDFECPGGCISGGCQTNYCTDSDNGDKPYQLGVMDHQFADMDHPAVDYCYSDNNKLMEYFCDASLHPGPNPSYHNKHSYVCPLGCTTEYGIGRCKTMADIFAFDGDASFGIFDWFSGNDDDDEPIVDTTGATLEDMPVNRIWQPVSDKQDVLTGGFIRGFDGGVFDTDLKCPDGHLVSSIELSSENWWFVPHIYGITLHCSPAGGDELLDLSVDTTRSWNVYTNNGGFPSYDNRLVTGLKGYYTLAGLEFIKKMNARQTQFLYNQNTNNVADTNYPWLEIPGSLWIATNANAASLCPPKSGSEVSGMSGVRIHKVMRNGKEVVSGLRIRCSSYEWGPEPSYNPFS